MERTSAKYVSHENGSQIRVPGYVVRERVKETVLGSRISSLISTNSAVKPPNKTNQMPDNCESVIRLRKLARDAGNGLEIMARKMGFSEYAVVLRGSTARANVRSSGAMSDLDMNFIVREEVSQEQRDIIRNWGYSFYGVTKVKADVLLFPVQFYIANKGCEARACVRDCALPLKDKGGVFNEVRWAAFESLRYLEICRSGFNLKKKLVLQSLTLASNGNDPRAVLGEHSLWGCVSKFLDESGVSDAPNQQEYATKLLRLLND